VFDKTDPVTITIAGTGEWDVDAYAQALFNLLSQALPLITTDPADPDGLKLADTLGVLVSIKNRWDGEDVGKFLIHATYGGLEDANWHTECGLFYDWSQQLAAGKTLDQVLPLEELKVQVEVQGGVVIHDIRITRNGQPVEFGLEVIDHDMEDPDD
jgi:hypothetical protein